MRNLGIVGSVIGAIILIFGLVKYINAESLYKASSWFGENDTSQIWGGYMDNYKIFMIAGAVILVIFVILLIAGIINSNGRNENNGSVSENSQ